MANPPRMIHRRWVPSVCGMFKSLSDLASADATWFATDSIGPIEPRPFPRKLLYPFGLMSADPLHPTLKVESTMVFHTGSPALQGFCSKTVTQNRGRSDRPSVRSGPSKRHHKAPDTRRRLCTKAHAISEHAQNLLLEPFYPHIHQSCLQEL